MFSIDLYWRWIKWCFPLFSERSRDWVFVYYQICFRFILYLGMDTRKSFYYFSGCIWSCVQWFFNHNLIFEILTYTLVHTLWYIKWHTSRGALSTHLVLNWIWIHMDFSILKLLAPIFLALVKPSPNFQQHYTADGFVPCARASSLLSSGHRIVQTTFVPNSEVPGNSANSPCPRG
jgi:hypothetical protein